MKRLFIWRRWQGAVVLITAAALMLGAGAAQAAGPGSHTQAEVNASVEKGVAYIDTQQNPNGSYGSSEPIAETGMSLIAYSVLANGSFANLSATYQAHVTKAIEWLLTQQETASGYWADFGFYETYSTGLAIAGLEPFNGVNAGVPAAIAKGRAFLEGEFQGAAGGSPCSSEEGSETAYFCGGWNYDKGEGRSDESNTGFAMFGLHQTGGVPAAIAAQNIGWQHHIQQITSNPFAQRNDGGGGYQPGINFGGFSSNANDTGSMLFGFGYDGVPVSNEGVVAGSKFGEDILNEYELEKEVSRSMIAHSGANEDGTCTIGAESCDWFISGDGGYHYSLFALTKGLGEYTAPKLKEASNWYAKVVDLLLTQQETSGAWPQDGRDDASVIFATALSVSSLGLVGVPEVKTSLSGEGQSGATLTVKEGNAVTDSATLTGTDIATATGTLTYTVYSDNECTKEVASAGTKTVTGGVVPASEPVTLAAGTYYWQASYGGDETHSGASSKCAEEQLTVIEKPKPRPHWFSNGTLIPEGQVEPVTSSGELTLQVPGSKLSVTCNVKDKETIVNPPRGGAGTDETTEVVFSNCSGNASPCSWGKTSWCCNKKTPAPCERGSRVELVPLGGLLRSHLAATPGQPVRDVIEGIVLQVRCSNGTVLDTYHGTLTPTVGNSVLQFGASSGELEDPAGGKATLSGKDWLKGPRGDENITAKLPPYWYSNGTLIPEGEVEPVTSSGELTLQVPGSRLSVTCNVKDKETIVNPPGGGAGTDETTEVVFSNCSGNASPCSWGKTSWCCNKKTPSPCPKGTRIELSLASQSLRSHLIWGSGQVVTDVIEGIVLEVRCSNGTVLDTYTGALMPSVEGGYLQYGAGSGELEDPSGGKATVSGSDKLRGPKGDEWITAESQGGGYW